MTQGEGSSPSQIHISQCEKRGGQSWRSLVIFMATCGTPFLETKLFLPTTNPSHQQQGATCPQLLDQLWAHDQSGLAELFLRDLDMACREVSNFPLLNDLPFNSWEMLMVITSTIWPREGESTREEGRMIKWRFRKVNRGETGRVLLAVKFHFFLRRSGILILGFYEAPQYYFELLLMNCFFFP